jgi:hypothetical protein
MPPFDGTPSIPSGLKRKHEPVFGSRVADDAQNSIKCPYGERKIETASTIVGHLAPVHFPLNQFCFIHSLANIVLT